MTALADDSTGPRSCPNVSHVSVLAATLES